MDHDRDDRAWLDRGTARKQLDPPKLEMPPRSQRGFRAREINCTMAQDCARGIYVEIRGRLARNSDGMIRQRKRARLVDELFNLRSSGPVSQKHASQLVDQKFQ